MSITNPISTNNGAVNITSGTGAINIGADAAAKAITIGNNTGATSVNINVGLGGLNVPSFTTTGAVVSNASGLLTDADASTAGYVLTSNGSLSAPSFQAPAAGGMTWNVANASQSMAAGNGYIANGASLVVLTLPVTAAVGTLISIQGYGSGGWQVAQNSGQQIFVGSVSTTATTGTMSSANRYDSINLICTVADTIWCSLGGPQSAGLNLT